MNLRRLLMVGKNVNWTRKYPVSLIHFVTNRCNARCPHCFIDFGDAVQQTAQMSIDEIDRLTRNLGPNLINVNLTGGEPFLREDLIEIARCYLGNTQIESIFITSNGTFVDRVLEFGETLPGEFPSKKIFFSFPIDDFLEQHNATRKAPGIFENALRCYRGIREIGGCAQANIGITISHTNHEIVMDLYRHLVEEEGVRSISVTIVRDQGVYATPPETRAAIFNAYREVTTQLVADLRCGVLQGYDNSSLQGRLMNRKNVIKFGVIADMYPDNRFISPCYAGSLFGVIGADGTVYPCEILDRPLGNLRDYGFDLMRLWADSESKMTREWIMDTKCRCTYECAWSFNIMGNLRYQPALLASVLVGTR